MATDFSAIRLIGDSLLVRLEKRKEVSDGGIVLPQVAVDELGEVKGIEQQMVGEVLARGPGLISEVTMEPMPMYCDVGDRVVLAGVHPTHRVMVDGEEFLSIPEKHVRLIYPPAGKTGG